MNKEKLMQFLSDAIDKGATIDICLHGNGESKETAESRIKEFNEIIGNTKVVEHESDHFKWFRASNLHLGLSHFYDVVPSHFMEEDVDLTGGVEDVI